MNKIYPTNAKPYLSFLWSPPYIAKSNTTMLSTTGGDNKNHNDNVIEKTVEKAIKK